MNSDFSKLSSKIQQIQREYQYTFRFNKKAELSEVHRFEEKFNLKLPEDYKEFIVNIGNGGEFKFCHFDFNNYLRNINKLDSISKEFPLTEAMVWSEENDTSLNENVFNGQIIIESGGCGNFTFLVVKGNESGNVWWHEWPSNDEIIPFTGFNWNNRIQPFVRKKFSQWYSELIDLNLESIKTAYNNK